MATAADAVAGLMGTTLSVKASADKQWDNCQVCYGVVWIVDRCKFRGQIHFWQAFARCGVVVWYY